jgi:opacity protein-like surface antigen
MKKYIYTTLSVSLALVVTTMSAMAVPFGGSNNPFDYAIKGKDLSRLSMGIYGGQFKRDIKWDSGFKQELTSNRGLFYVGVDLVNWFSLYAIGGASQSSLNSGSYGDTQGEFGVGLSMNLLNHMIAEPVITCDAIRFNFSARYLNTGSSIAGDIDWDELSASLTMELVNNTTGNKFYSPESISLYVGPIYSTLISSDFEEDSSFGIIGGIQCYIVDTISLDLEVQYFDTASVAGGLNFHF